MPQEEEKEEDDEEEEADLNIADMGNRMDIMCSSFIFLARQRVVFRSCRCRRRTEIKEGGCSGFFSFLLIRVKTDLALSREKKRKRKRWETHESKGNWRGRSGSDTPKGGGEEKRKP